MIQVTNTRALQTGLSRVFQIFLFYQLHLSMFPSQQKISALTFLKTMYVEMLKILVSTMVYTVTCCKSLSQLFKISLVKYLPTEL